MIESITNYREPQDTEAIYLLMPTSQNVDRIIRDFDDGRRQYAKAHLIFIDGLWLYRPGTMSLILTRNKRASTAVPRTSLCIASWTPPRKFPRSLSQLLGYSHFTLLHKAD